MAIQVPSRRRPRHRAPGRIRRTFRLPKVPKQLTVPCPTCKGTGAPTSFSAAAFLGECATCHGYGTLPATAAA